MQVSRTQHRPLLRLLGRDGWAYSDMRTSQLLVGRVGYQRGEMTRRVSAILLAALLVLAGSCNESSEDESSNAFDFSTQSLCDWFSPEDIDEIVTSTYEELDVLLVRGEEISQRLDQNSDCYWAEPLVTLSHNDDLRATESFESHPALDESVRVSVQVDGSYGLMHGLDALLIVDGHDEQLWFGHAVSNLLDGDVETINAVGLTIANRMLGQMGWINES